MASNPAEPLNPGGMFRCFQCDAFCTFSADELARMTGRFASDPSFKRCPVCTRRAQQEAGRDGEPPKAKNPKAQSRRDYLESFILRRLIGGAEVKLGRELPAVYYASYRKYEQARRVLDVEPRGKDQAVNLPPLYAYRLGEGAHLCPTCYDESDLSEWDGMEDTIHEVHQPVEGVSCASCQSGLTHNAYGDSEGQQAQTVKALDVFGEVHDTGKTEAEHWGYVEQQGALFDRATLPGKPRPVPAGQGSLL